MPNLYVQTPGNKNFIFELNLPEITIGRELKNDLILDDPRVSRLHATIRKTDSGVILRDMGSGNGTFVNGQRIQPNVDVTLTSEDQVKLGSCTVTLQVTDPLRTSTPSESFREVLQKAPNELLSISALHSFNCD